MAWLTVAAISGCGSLPLGQNERDIADGIATGAGLTARVETAGPFRLLTYRRGLDAGAGPVRVYIEGDGRAWRGRRPPRDPTPFEPTGLRLAALDPAPSVLWLARPCMYLPEGSKARCDVRWWTSHRYASAVVTALDELLTRTVGSRGVALVGHSGGGALATLLAARRTDARSLLTVASPLDLSAWVRHHRMTPLHGSLDPVAVAHLLGRLPQRHLAGGRDRVVPPDVVRGFLRALPNPNRATLRVYPDRDHGCCWAEEWPPVGSP